MQAVSADGVPFRTLRPPAGPSDPICIVLSVLWTPLSTFDVPSAATCDPKKTTIPLSCASLHWPGHPHPPQPKGKHERASAVLGMQDVEGFGSASVGPHLEMGGTSTGLERPRPTPTSRCRSGPPAPRPAHGGQCDLDTGDHKSLAASEPGHAFHLGVTRQCAPASAFVKGYHFLSSHSHCSPPSLVSSIYIHVLSQPQHSWGGCLVASVADHPSWCPYSNLLSVCSATSSPGTKLRWTISSLIGSSPRRGIEIMLPRLDWSVLRPDFRLPRESSASAVATSFYNVRPRSRQIRRCGGMAEIPS